MCLFACWCVRLHLGIKFLEVSREEVGRGGGKEGSGGRREGGRELGSEEQED